MPMETALETPLQNPVPSEDTVSDCKTPPRNQETGQEIQNSGNDSGSKTATPDRLKVPKAFKYPERYRSPTDLMISPVSKGLLARSRKTGSGFANSGSGSFSSLKDLIRGLLHEMDS